MPNYSYVTWKGRDRGEASRIHEIPVEALDHNGELIAGVVQAVFRRDYQSGRLVYKADIENPALESAINRFRNDLDPRYFEVSDGPPITDLTYVQNMFGTSIDLDSFKVQLASNNDPSDLKQMFRKMSEAGVALQYVHAVGERLKDVKQMLVSQQETLREIEEEERAEAAAPPPAAKSKSAPPPPPAGG